MHCLRVARRGSYDDLVATMKLRGAVPEKMKDADVDNPKGKCTTGREPACK